MVNFNNFYKINFNEVINDIKRIEIEKSNKNILNNNNNLMKKNIKRKKT